MALIRVSQLCLVVRGVDSRDRPVICFQEATVEVSAKLMRRREICARCASEVFKLHSKETMKIRFLPTIMGMLLR